MNMTGELLIKEMK